MAERDFVILRHQGKVPVMASCVKCQRKFFTPPPTLVILSELKNTCSVSLIGMIARKSQRGSTK